MRRAHAGGSAPICLVTAAVAIGCSPVEQAPDPRPPAPEAFTFARARGDLTVPAESICAGGWAFWHHAEVECGCPGCLPCPASTNCWSDADCDSMSVCRSRL